MNHDADLQNALDLLKHSQSSKRKSGAKKLRKMQNKEAGPNLLLALEKEIADPRTWETQYQLIMAIGECEITDGMSFMRNLSHQNFEATMVYMAIGDTIIRLAFANNDDSTVALEELLATENASLIEGGLRAVAMLKLI